MWFVFVCFSTSARRLSTCLLCLLGKWLPKATKMHQNLPSADTTADHMEQFTPAREKSPSQRKWNAHAQKVRIHQAKGTLEVLKQVTPPPVLPEGSTATVAAAAATTAATAAATTIPRLIRPCPLDCPVIVSPMAPESPRKLCFFDRFPDAMLEVIMS